MGFFLAIPAVAGLAIVKRSVALGVGSTIVGLAALTLYVGHQLRRSTKLVAENLSTRFEMDTAGEAALSTKLAALEAGDSKQLCRRPGASTPSEKSRAVRKIEE